ncbi:MAG TPA: hypothetical protein VG944_14755 [Fimbriimonas sp.]|nr:hypothetical protein [Fimbriimonas sp.]
MWKAYAGQVGVAIRSSVTRLKGALKDLAWVEAIKYIDYDVENFGLQNLKDPYVHKRTEFEHEREVRAIAWESVVQLQHSEVFQQAGTQGFSLSLDPADYFEEIVVCPELSGWFTLSLKKIVDALGYSIPVRESGVFKDPYRLYKEDRVTALRHWDDVDSVSAPKVMVFDPCMDYLIAGWQRIEIRRNIRLVIERDNLPVDQGLWHLHKLILRRPNILISEDIVGLWVWVQREQRLTSVFRKEDVDENGNHREPLEIKYDDGHTEIWWFGDRANEQLGQRENA